MLGVSLTGIMDHVGMSGDINMCDDYKFSSHGLEQVLRELRQHSRDTNEIWANMLAIPSSAAITCVKYISALAA